MSRSPDQQEFARLFQAAEESLYRYILATVPRHADALDILQETATALWEKFAEYDPALPFGPWARKFAHMQVLKYRLYKRLPSGKNVLLSKSAIEAVNSEYEQHEMVLDARLAALRGCLERLQPDDRKLLDWRYWENVNLRTTAEHVGLNEDQIYRRLRRIRRSLGECIDRTLASEA